MRRTSSKFTKFYLLGPPTGVSPLIFRKIESPFPKDGSYQIWLKSFQWFLRRRKSLWTMDM